MPVIDDAYKRKQVLKEAADFLRATAADYDEMATRMERNIHRPETTPNEREEARRHRAMWQLLSGQANQIEAL